MMKTSKYCSFISCLYLCLNIVTMNNFRLLDHHKRVLKNMEKFYKKIEVLTRRINVKMLEPNLKRKQTNC